MGSSQDSWESVIRAACKAYPESLYALSKAAGVDQGQLRRFVAGEQSIGIVTAEKLGRLLGIELKAPKHARKNRRAGE